MSQHGSERANREHESSKLVITGVDVEGKEFREETYTIDVSETGISFPLKTPLWMDAHLTIDIRSSDLLGPHSVVKAKVVRFGKHSDDGRFVCARFD
jgi:PilZ domain